MARPSKLTPEVARQIVRAIRAGNYAEPAAASAGVSESTYHRWMKRGAEESSGIYADFYADVKRAEAEAEVEAVALVRKAMPEDPGAAFKYLERRYPQRWRRRESHEHSGPGGGPLQIGQAMVDDPETRRAFRVALEKASEVREGESAGPGAGD